MNAQHVRHRLRDVVVDAPPEAHSIDDRREIVSEQHECRRFARDVRSAAAHRDADVRGLQRRGVIDTIAGHRDDRAVGAESPDQAQFFGGWNACVDVHDCGALAQYEFVHRGKLLAGQQSA